MSRFLFICPACRAAVLAPRALAGAEAPCPRCGAAVDSWPEPVEAAPATPPPPLVAGHARSAFVTMLSGSLGCFVALVLVLAVLIGVTAYRAARRDARGSGLDGPHPRMFGGTGNGPLC